MLDYSLRNLKDLPLFNGTDASATALDLSINDMISIDCARLPKTLLKLVAHNNQLSFLLAPFTKTLKYINVSSNNLTSLPLLPHYLTYLNISNNLFTELPNYLPNTLQELHAAHNEIEKLPFILPLNLIDIIIPYNNITYIPYTISTLKKLEVIDIRHNLLRDLPEDLPDSLYMIKAERNNIYRLPSRIPRTLTYFTNDLTKTTKDFKDFINFTNHLSHIRTFARNMKIRNELYEVCWHPTNIVHLGIWNRMNFWNH
jgi:Leucine-rich repeat (LRR) protein